VLDLDPDDEADKKRIKAILKKWFANGVLTTAERKDEHRHAKKFVVPGNWREQPDDDQEPVRHPDVQGAAKVPQGAAALALPEASSSPRHPTSIGVRGDAPQCRSRQGDAAPASDQGAAQGGALEVIGVEPDGTVCSQCGMSTGTVYLIRDPFKGATSEPVHEDCVKAWFTK
jgi:hypothetical protein